jgi:hypothetical protein
MISNSQTIIILLIVLICLQLWQCFSKDLLMNTRTENFHPDNYKVVDYNTKMMSCDGNSGMLNNKCQVKSNLPTAQMTCNKGLTLKDGPNYDTKAGKAIQKDINGMNKKLTTSGPAKIRKEPKIENKEDDNSLLELLNNRDLEANESKGDIKSVGELDN